MGNQVKTNFIGQFWLVYFIFSILWMGILSAYLVCIPMYILGYFYKDSQILADRILCKAVEWLMAVQPWYKAQVSLDIPSGKILLISNHRSHLDAFILLSNIPGIRMLTRSNLFKVPFLGAMMLFTRQIPAKRGKLGSLTDAMDEVKKRIAEQERVLIFPEMTRCKPGLKGTQPFSLLPFQAAAQAGAKIIPIVFKRTDESWPKGAASLNFRRLVEVKSLKPVDPSLFSSVPELRDHVRSMIDQELKA